MTAHSAWDEAQIHAFVDGELDAQSAAQLQADSHADADLAARVARQRELRRLLQSTFDPVLDEPVPRRLHDAIAAGAAKAAIFTLDAARQKRESRRSAWSPRHWGALAATLVFGTLLGAVMFRAPVGLPVEMLQGRLVARDELDAALSTQPSGPVHEGAASRIGLSFQAADGAYCRTFNLRSGATGLACRRLGRWGVQVLDNTGEGRTDAAEQFRQAGSTLSPAVAGAITALGAGEALTPQQEQQALRSGWDAATPAP